jgi:hypothetical protein
VDAAERLAATPVGALRPAAWMPFVRPLSAAFVAGAELPLVERLYWSPARQDAERDRARALGAKERRRQAKRRDRVSRVARKARQQVVVRVRTAAKQALTATGLLKHS